MGPKREYVDFFILLERHNNSKQMLMLLPLLDMKIINFLHISFVKVHEKENSKKKCCRNY